jgi:outer membrane protein OmpA-like peptidoglycan-associated protein
MKRSIFIIITLAITKSGFAQYKETPKAFGDKAFANKDYYEAAFYYKKAAEGLSLVQEQAIPYHAIGKEEKKGKPEDRAYICYQLGESYRLYENYVEAEPWYFKVLDENFGAKYPLARFWYGVCLRANQHFDEAIKQLGEFKAAYTGDDQYKDIAQKEMDNCQFAKEQYQYPVLMDVAGLKLHYYSDGSDYSLVQRDSNIYFTSSRFIKNEKKHLNRVYTVKENADNPVAIDFKDEKSKEQLEYGTPSFSPNGKKMYITRWYKEGSKTLHGIYISDFTDGEWTTPVKLNSNVNADGFNSIQPFITADGKQLYFTSNKPGGQGGDDIWMSDLGDDGNPVNSINLGASINTALDEQAPYYDISAKRLIYSSKGFTGLGGFDFYESFYDGEKWSSPQNMGYPMNSAKDDLYYFPDHDNPNKFYLSSDRESDCCLNLFEGVDKRHTLAGLVTDCDTHAPLPGVRVSFIDSISKKTIKQIVADSSARYAFAVTTKRPYYLMLEKEGYFTKNIPVPAAGTMGHDTLYNPDICLQAYKVDKPIVIANVLYDFNKATLRPESKVVLNGLVTIMKDNPKIIVELAAHTDSIGTDAYNMKLSQARAQSCVDYIVSSGIEERRIYAKGYGKRKPIAPNSLPNGKDNPEGRQLNRRTEFTVIKTEQLTIAQ